MAYNPYENDNSPETNDGNRRLGGAGQHDDATSQLKAKDQSAASSGGSTSSGSFGSTPSAYDKDSFVKSGSDLGRAEKNSWGTGNAGPRSSAGSSKAKSGSELSSAEKGESSDKAGWKTRVGDAAMKRWGAPSEDDYPKGKKGGGGHKKAWAAGFAGGTLVLFAGVLIAIFMFLGNFKNVHFAEILRSVGMARFTYSMRQAYSRTIFDSVVLTDKSTGSLADNLKGMRKSQLNRLKQFSVDQNVKFEVDKGSKLDQIRGNNIFQGLSVDGTDYRLNDYAKAAFDKDYNKLSYRERLTVRSQFNIASRNALNEALGTYSLFQRFKIYQTLRSAAGIRMFKWADKAREYFGKSPQEARKLNVDETIQAVDEGSERPKTGVDAIDEEADKAQEDAKKAAESGAKNAGQVRTSWAKALRTTTKVSDAVFVTTAACIIHSLSNSLDQTQEQTQKQALRLGQDPITTRGQIAEGDVVAEAVAADSDRYDEAEKSVAYKQATGEGKLTPDDVQQISDVPNIEGPSGTFKDVIGGVNDFIETTTVGGPWISGILDAFGADGFKGKLTDKACNVILNQYVQYSIAGGEVLVSIVSAGATKGVIAGIKAAITGGLQIAGSIGLGELLGSLLDKAVGSAAGLDYSGTETGVPLFNQEYVGVTSYEAYGSRSVLMGAPGSKEDTQKLQKTAMNDVYEQNSQLPFMQRYFAIDNPYSLTGKAIAIAPTNFADLADMIRSGLGSVAAIFSTPQQMFGTIGNIFMPHQYASAEEDVNLVGLGGVKPWILDDDEQAMMDTPEFDWPANQDYYEAHKDQLDKDYGQCYADGTELQSQIPDVCYSTVEENGKTVPYLKTDAARHYRFYYLEQHMAELGTGDIQ
jgi:hypothetical protein